MGCGIALLTRVGRTRDQQRFTVSEVPQRIMQPSNAYAYEQETHGAAYRHTIAQVCRTEQSEQSSRSLYIR